MKCTKQRAHYTDKLHAPTEVNMYIHAATFAHNVNEYSTLCTVTMLVLTDNLYSHVVQNHCKLQSGGHCY